MQSCASCLLPSLLRCCSCLLCSSSGSGSSSHTAILLCQLVHCSGLLQPLVYKLVFKVYAGIACLYCVCWDKISSFFDLQLVSTACWESDAFNLVDVSFDYGIAQNDFSFNMQKKKKKKKGGDNHCSMEKRCLHIDSF